jgi:hypothetical protein
MLQRGALAGSLQCFAKTNVGYEAAQQFFNCYARVDPTRARYLPVPSTAHLALQPIHSERQLLQASKISTRQPSRTQNRLQQLFLAIYESVCVNRLLEIFSFLMVFVGRTGPSHGLRGIVDERR